MSLRNPSHYTMYNIQHCNEYYNKIEVDYTRFTMQNGHNASLAIKKGGKRRWCASKQGHRDTREPTRYEWGPLGKAWKHMGMFPATLIASEKSPELEYHGLIPGCPLGWPMGISIRWNARCHVPRDERHPTGHLIFHPAPSPYSAPRDTPRSRWRHPAGCV